MGVLIAMGLFCVAVGIGRLLFPDVAWRIHAWGKRVEGVQAERTPEWEGMGGCWAVFMVLMGIGILVVGCSALARRADPPRPGGPGRDVYFDRPEGELPPDVRRLIEEQGLPPRFPPEHGATDDGTTPDDGAASPPGEAASPPAPDDGSEASPGTGDAPSR